jgi:MFS family permease
MRDIWNLVARNRDYRLLLAANMISSAGDWILNVGMTFYVYQITGSALASGTMLLMGILPSFLLGSAGGVFADRWDRRRTMVVTNLLLACALLPLFLVHAASQLWILYLTVFVECSIGQFFAPAEAAMVSTVVGRPDLVAANALNAQGRQVARLGGAGIGGALAAAGGITLVASVDVASYLVAAGLVALVAARPVVRAKKNAVSDGPEEGFWQEWLAGIKLCVGQPELSALLTFRLMSGFGEGVFSVLLAPLVISVLQANQGEYGSVVAFQAIGGIAGGLAVAAYGRRGSPILLLGYGATLFGVFDLAIAVYPLALPVLWPILVLIAVVGVPSAAMNAAFNSLQQMSASDEFRGRVFGAINTGWAVSMTLGTVLAGALGDTVGIIPIFALQGLIHIVAGPLTLARLRRTPANSPVVAVGEGARS